MSKKVLVIEDDPVIRENVLELLDAEGFSPIAAQDGDAGIGLARSERPDLIVCDVMMPGLDGFGVLATIRDEPQLASTPFIFLSARADRADVRAGMRLGADDYVTKPFTRVELLEAVRARLDRQELATKHLARVHEIESTRPSFPGIPGVSGAAGEPIVRDAAMRALYDDVARVARSPLSVVLLGETGVGKEVVANAIHRLSPRAGRPFVAINCAALSESLLESELFGHEKGAFTGALQARAGLLESAEGGTVFLDELGEIPLPFQVKLLRVLEDRKVTRVGSRTPKPIDVRFVSATNRDLENEVEKGTFRSDLYFRLNGITLTIPPLRSRTAEIVPLAESFVAKAARALGVAPPAISPAAADVLGRYGWPGNVRELRNVMDRAAVLCDAGVIQPEHLPSKIASLAATPGAPVSPIAAVRIEMEAIERKKILEALDQCGGNQTKAAELLGISRRTLVSRMSEYDLPRPRKKA